MKDCSYTLPASTELGFAFGELRLEPDGTLFRGEAAIHLPPKELAALRLLLTNAGHVVTPGQLKDSLWKDVHVTPDSISKCLSSLRARLEPDECIQTVYKRGYRLKGPVRRHETPNIRGLARMAIVPFAPGPQVAEHLGPGIAEETTARLASMRTPPVAVLARDSVFTLARRGMTAQQIGQTLNASLVLTGTLHALPLHFRLRVEMVRVADGAQIWTEDILASRDRVDELETDLAGRLCVRLGVCAPFHGDLANLGNHGLVPDAAAHEMFLRGHYEWQTLERHRMQDGTQHLLRAAEMDPSLIAAQVDVVNACVTQCLYGFMSPKTAYEQVHRIAEAIPDLPDNAPPILPALGWITFHVDRDLPMAQQLFAACDHLPHDPWTTRMRVMFALSRHRFDEARDLLQSALEVDPCSPWLHAWLAWTLHLANRNEESLDQIERSLREFPEHASTTLYGAVILAFHGQGARASDLASSLARRTPYFDIATAVHAYALAREGHRTEAQGMLDRLQWLGRERYVLGSFVPAACAALGDVEGAIAELHASDAARCPWYFQMLADPRLEVLNGEAEFDSMRAGVEVLEFSAAEPLEYAR